MFELTWAKLQAEGLTACLKNPERRNVTAQKLSTLVAHHLAELDEADREKLAQLALSEWWPTALERCAGAREHYWPELLCSLAVALTLLHGNLPDSVKDSISADSLLLSRYQKSLLPFQRFALIVAEKCHPVRVFLGQPPARQAGEWTLPANIEDSAILKWCLVPHRPFVERSHTGMLALCALDRSLALSLPSDRPFAATAELDADGQTLKAVNLLIEKKRVFFEQFPDGVLLTAPPLECLFEKWQTLLSNGEDESAHAKFASRFGPGGTQSGDEAASNSCWLCAGSLDEAAEKLAALSSGGSKSSLFEPLRAWDGSSIPVDAIISTSIHDDYKDDQKISQFRGQERLFNLCWSLRYETATRPSFWPLGGEDSTSGKLPPLSRLLHRVSQAETDDEKAAIWADQDDLLKHAAGSLARRESAKGTGEAPDHDGRIIARGAIFYGAPGSGKSIWSQGIPAQFVRGPLGALGMAVRVTARRLVQKLEGVSSEASLLDILCGLVAAQGQLLQRLHDQKRLFVIIDGLDEVSAASLAHIGRLLRSHDAPFLATTRDAHHSLDSFPPYLRYRIQPIEVQQVSQFLIAMQRTDLRAQLCTEQAHGPLKFKELSPPVRAFCDTPLTLSLLCQGVRRGEQLAALRYSDLYERAFQAMLTRAKTEQRLSESQVELLQRTVSKVLGELALAWLRSPTGYITDEAIHACLEHNGITGLDAIRYQQALEHGNLLIPGDSRRELAHKTIAEWSAARALELDVQRRVFRASSERRRIDYVLIEIDSINDLLGAETPVHTSPFRHTILFFACWSRAPLALVKRVIEAAVGSPSQAATAKDGAEVFNYARELALQANWQIASEALTVWALLVRRELFPTPDDDEDETSPYRGRQRQDRGEPAPLAHLTRQLAPFIPKEKQELLALVAQTAEQRASLEEDTTQLLPYCTENQASAFISVLSDGDPRQIASIVAYFEQWKVPLRGQTLDRLCQFALESEQQAAEHWERVRNQEIKAELDSEDDVDDWNDAHSKLWFGSQEALREAKECETRIYSICATLEHLPPRALLHRRLLAWPGHLTKELTRVLEVLVEKTSASELRDHLIVLIDEQSAIEQVEAEQFDKVVQHSHRELLAGAICDKVDCEEEIAGWGRWHRFQQLAEAVGWKLPHKASRPFGVRESEDEKQLWKKMLSAIESAADAKHFLAALLKLLIERADVEQRASTLWLDLPDEPPYKMKLIFAFAAAGRLPACIDMTELIATLAPQQFADRKLFSSSQAKALDALADGGRGRGRFCALFFRRGEKHGYDLPDWEPFLSKTDDPELVELVKTHIRSRYLSDEDKARLFPDEVDDQRLLAEQVRSKRPGWDARLLAALMATQDIFGERAEAIYTLIHEGKLTAALPELLRRVQLVAVPRGHSRLAEVLLSLEPQPSDDVIEALMRWPMDRLPDVAFAHIQERHVPTLLSLGDIPLYSRYLLPRLKGMSGEHLALLQTRLAELRAEHQEVQAQQLLLKQQKDQRLQSGEGSPPQESGESSATHWQQEFQLGDRIRKIEQRLELLEQVAFLWHCNRHPGLAELCGYLEKEPCKSLKDDVAPRLKACLAESADEFHLLERLLHHPEEYVRRLAYGEIQSRTAQPAQIDMIIVALQAHLKFQSNERIVRFQPQARWNSKTEAELEAQYGYTDDLLTQLRERLTPAHRRAMQRLVHAESPLLRARSATWMGELGGDAFLPLIRSLIGDPNPEVCAAGLRAFERLTISSERASILDCDRSAWTSVHYSQLLRWLLYERRSVPYANHEFRDVRRPTLAIESPALLAELMKAALSSFAKETGLRTADNPALFMTAVYRWEQLAAKLDGGRATKKDCWLDDDELLAAAAGAPEPVRAALYRRLVARGSHLVPTAVAALLNAENLRDRVLGAECHLLSGASNSQGTVREIWQAAFTQLREQPVRPWNDDQPADYSVDDRIRLARALLQAASGHVPLAELVARQIFEHYEHDDEGLSEPVVNDPESVSILRMLVERQGLLAARAVLHGILPSTTQLRQTRYPQDSFEWAERVFLSRRDVLPDVLSELVPHLKFSRGLRQLYDALTDSTPETKSEAERLHLRTELLPREWVDEA